LTAESVVDLSIIVVTWNAFEVTAACLDSIQRTTTGIRYEAIVIDNGTTKDVTVSEIPRRYPWVRFIANPENRGFTRANNQGIREAVGRYVLLLNSDTVQTENAVGEAVRYMDAHTDVGALGIMHRNNDAGRTFQPSFFPFPRPWAESLGLLGLRSQSPLVSGRKAAMKVAPKMEQGQGRKGQEQERERKKNGTTKRVATEARRNLTEEPAEQDVDWVCGSFLMIRRAVLERVGHLDDRYFAYCEDIDWCLAARRAGVTVRFWPGVSMIHIGSVSAPHLRDKTGLMFRSHLTFLRKNHGVLAAAGYYAAMGTRLVLALAAQVLKWCVGRATRADVVERRTRLTGFLALRSHTG
jgi:GT2 family glycosyltransferase